MIFFFGEKDIMELGRNSWNVFLFVLRKFGVAHMFLSYLLVEFVSALGPNGTSPFFSRERLSETNQVVKKKKPTTQNQPTTWTDFQVHGKTCPWESFQDILGKKSCIDAFKKT